MAKSKSMELTPEELSTIHEYLKGFIEDGIYSVEMHLTTECHFKLHRTKAISVFKTGHTQEVFQSLEEFENYFKIL